MNPSLEELINDPSLAPDFKERLKSYSQKRNQLHLLNMEMNINRFTLPIISQILQHDTENGIDTLGIGVGSNRWVSDNELSELIHLIHTKKSKIDTLILSLREMGIRSIEEFKTLLTKTEARILHLYSDSITDDNIKEFIEILGKKSNFKEISFQGIKLTDACFPILFDYARTTRLNAIHVGGRDVSMSEATSTELAKCFLTMPYLKDVLIRAKNISEASQKKLEQAFNESSIQELTLTGFSNGLKKEYTKKVPTGSVTGCPSSLFASKSEPSTKKTNGTHLTQNVCCMSSFN